MARKEKFALDMGGGKEVRSLEELQDAFNIDRVIGYFQDGSLLTWLDDRYYDEAAEAIDGLSMTDPQFNEKLCAALGVEYKGGGLDPEDVKILQEKTEKLKKYNPSENVLANACRTAFTQEDLADLLDRGEETIFLCGPTFTIPARVKNKEYIGIFEKPTIKISVTDPAVLAERGITFSNVFLPEGLEAALDRSVEYVEEEETQELSRANSVSQNSKGRRLKEERVRSLFRANLKDVPKWDVADESYFGGHTSTKTKAEKRALVLQMAGAPEVDEKEILMASFQTDVSSVWLLTLDCFYYYVNNKQGRIPYDTIIHAKATYSSNENHLMNRKGVLQVNTNTDAYGNLVNTWTKIPYVGKEERDTPTKVAKFLNGLVGLMNG